MKKKRNITILSNGVTFKFRDVPEEKYQNYILMTIQEPNTNDYTTKGFPYRIQLEPTNTCNLACPLCPVGSNELKRKPKHMSFQEVKSFIDDMDRYLLLLILWDWGEPFMNPELPKMIAYAHKKAIQTITSTNAHFLQKEQSVKDILTSGLTNLIIAIDSLDEKNYKVYRKRGDLNKALEGLKNVVKLKKELKSDTQINLRMV